MNVEVVLRRKNSRVVSVRLNESVQVAARMLHKENIGALAVQDVCQTEGNTLVGLFSERDIVRIIANQGPVAIMNKSVADFMSPNIISCEPYDSLEHALGLMLDHHIRHLPVLENGTLIGVISMREIMACLHGSAVDPAHVSSSDSQSLAGKQRAAGSY